MSKEKKNPQIKVYNGFGSADKALIMGHLFESAFLKRSKVTKGMLRNAWEIVKRYQVRPWKGQELTIQVNGQKFTVVTNQSGYFELVFKPGKQAGTFPFEVIHSKNPDVTAKGKVRISNPKEVLISDIDDTVVVSHSNHLLKKLYTLLSRTHERRKPFQGVQDFYAQLYHSTENQLFIYVSSSEWNLYDFIDDFCRFNHLPNGYYLLQDLKSGLLDLLKSGGGNHRHKLNKIKFVMEMFDDARITLIGDSGQQDPRIYEQVAAESPRRINKIYIRSLNQSKQAKLEQIKRRLHAIGIQMDIFT